MMKQLITMDCGTSVEISRDTIENIVTSKIGANGREDKDDAFFVADLSDVVHKYRMWTKLLPQVEPHYAVKCNEDEAVLQLLASLGTGFDCASKSEIQKVLNLGVPASRIVYANPCKQASYIKHAAKNKVSMMTFDNEPELHKVKALYPDAELIVRILPPADTKAQCELGMKYGCTIKEAGCLIRKAKELELNVIGVSFHVGSGCYEADAFAKAVVMARTVFDIGTAEGYNFTLLDIGGGFPGQKSASVSFEQICSTLRPALDNYFPASSGVRIISEPGRFFVASAYTVAVNVIAKRAIARDQDRDSDDCMTADDEPSYMYYVNDGVYGSFNCLLFDHAEVEPTILKDHDGDVMYTSSIWGPTCDGLDCIRSECQLPELQVGDWMCFKDMGAYTMCAASKFNGMPLPKVYYIMKDPTCFLDTLQAAKKENLANGLMSGNLLTCMKNKLPSALPKNHISI